MYIKTWNVEKRMEPGFFSWCPEAVDRIWNTGNPPRYWAMLFPCESDWALAEVVKFPSLEIVQRHPDMILATGCRWPCLRRGLDQVTSRGLFQPQSFSDSVKIKSSGSLQVLTSMQLLRWYFQIENIHILVRTDYFLLFSHKTQWEHSEAMVTISLADYSTKQNPAFFFMSWIFSKWVNI